MQNIKQIRDLACTFIDDIKNGQKIEKEKIDFFCKLSKVVIEALKVEITHNHQVGVSDPIQFLENK